MDDLEKRKALLQKIRARQARDAIWGRWDFIIAQCFLWIAIVASLGTALVIAFAQQPISKPITAIFAAIPGTVIVIDRTFSFAHRARWHRELYLRLDELANDLEFRDFPVRDVAERLSALRIKMQETFPGMASDHIKVP